MSPPPLQLSYRQRWLSCSTVTFNSAQWVLPRGVLIDVALLKG